MACLLRKQREPSVSTDDILMEESRTRCKDFRVLSDRISLGTLLFPTSLGETLLGSSVAPKGFMQWRQYLVISGFRVAKGNHYRHCFQAELLLESSSGEVRQWAMGASHRIHGRELLRHRRCALHRRLAAILPGLQRIPAAQTARWPGV